MLRGSFGRILTAFTAFFAALASFWHRSEPEKTDLPMLSGMSLRPMAK